MTVTQIVSSEESDNEIVILILTWYNIKQNTFLSSNIENCTVRKMGKYIVTNMEECKASGAFIAPARSDYRHIAGRC